LLKPGLFESIEKPGGPLVFQFLAGRAPLAQGRDSRKRIARAGMLFVAEIVSQKDRCTDGASSRADRSDQPHANEPNVDR
jgi:hypothetical protein